ncbi:MAG: DNA polymerase III subunit beta [Geobacteraceae bacterium GWC2_58_44]|nr:MAG: DNA polymerase III subunit beta [Geobacteraceae bacterium GWC2_58_44]HBG05088.1 DNA polymerase III subunit beta [Geobacter sp.]
MPHGLLDRDMMHILEAARSFPEISQLVLFGSRAKGNYKTASDVDLAIKGAFVTYDTAVRLADVLNEEKPLPYFFDVIHYEAITDPRLVEHIDRVGVVLYSKESEQEEKQQLHSLKSQEETA